MQSHRRSLEDSTLPHVRLLQRALIKMKNSWGSKIDPWGTPEVVKYINDLNPFSFSVSKNLYERK